MDARSGARYPGVVKAMHDLDSASLGAVLKTALDAVVVMRTDGTIAGWNDVAERTFGWSFADAVGKRMSEMIVPARFRDAHERGLAHYLATGEGPVLDRHFEIQALHRDGRELPVELSITPTRQFGEPVFLGFLRDISERHDAARRQEMMIGELNHRVKNLLGVVSGIADQTARSSTSIDTFAPAFSGRLAALARAHEVLSAVNWERAPLRAVVDDLLAPFVRGAGARATISGPDIFLGPRHLLGLAMILHELTTNAVKHGALSTPDGRVALDWTRDGETLAITWAERGVGDVLPPTRRGFGLRMIARGVDHDLRGRSTAEWHADGLIFRLSFVVQDEELGR